MKKLLLSGLAMLGGFVIMSCSSSNGSAAEKLFQENPVTISWGEKSSEVTSVCANVKVFSVNSRKNIPMKQTNSYRLVIKNQNGKTLTRVDSDSGVAKRSVVSDGNEVVVFDTATNDVKCRFANPDASGTSYEFLTASPITGRVNIELIKKEAARLSLDLTEDEKEKGLMVLQLPEGFVNAPNGEKVLKSKIVFDTTTETLNEVEVTTVPSEGVTVTTTQIPVYQESNGEYIKIGCVTTVDTKNENLIEGIPEDYQTFNSMDDIPEISEEDFKKLQASGNIHEEPNITFGNPADLSNVETVVELYDYVDVNNVKDEEFRLLTGETK